MIVDWFSETTPRHLLFLAVITAGVLSLLIYIAMLMMDERAQDRFEDRCIRDGYRVEQSPVDGRPYCFYGTKLIREFKEKS